jgi:formate hydrogenlyase transcriptional activator
VTFFLSKFSAKFGRPIERVDRQTMDRLTSYSWPGNIRELQNVIERAVVLSTGPVLRLGADLLPLGDDIEGAGQEPADGKDDAPLVSLADAERRHIESILAHTRGVVEGAEGAARILDLHPNTLRSRMKKLGIPKGRHEIS